MKNPNHRGLSVIETILVLALAALVTSFVALSFGQVNEAEALDKGADTLAAILSEARAMTLSSVGDKRYGVHFDANQAVLFEGDTYTPAAQTNVPTALNPLLVIQNVSLSGGGTNVVFDRLTGATGQPGSLQVALKNATTTYKTVTVNAAGLSERN